MATGKFHGGDDGQAGRHKRCAPDVLQLAPSGSAVMSETDRPETSGSPWSRVFTAPGAHHPAVRPALPREDISGAVQNRGPGPPRPRHGGSVEGRGQDPVQFSLRSDPTRFCRRLAEIRAAHSLRSVRPTAVSGRSGSVSGQLAKPSEGLAGGEAAVLNRYGAGTVVQGSQRVQERCFSLRRALCPLSSSENRGHEVLLGGASRGANQICDRHVEFSWMHHRGVEQ